MKNEKVILGVKNKVSVHEKISVMVMMLGGFALAAGLVVGLIDQESVTVITEDMSDTASTTLTMPDPDSDFTLIALPDTQKYSDIYPQYYVDQTEWIINNRINYNILFVTHEGDVVEHGSVEREWNNAMYSMGLLDEASIPYAVAVGNHDYNTVSSRNATNINNYLNIDNYNTKDWWGGAYEDDSVENTYQFFSSDNVDYMIMHLEFCPRNAVIDWANDIISDNMDKKVIITTHGLLNEYGWRMSQGEDYSCEYYDLDGDNGGMRQWEKLYSQHRNIFMVLCGHMDEAAHVHYPGIYGNEVHLILADYQARDNGGNGYLRIMQFSESENKVSVLTYSPTLYSQGSPDAYLTSIEHQFEFTPYEPMTFHVDEDYSGDLENGSVEYPFNTIQEGVNLAQAGDTVLVQPGTYNEQVAISVSGISLVGTDHNTTIIDGGGGDAVISTEGITEGIITGFTIRNARNGIVANNDSENITIKENLIIDTIDTGIHFSRSSGSLINNTIAVENSDKGVVIDRFGSIEMRNNIITANRVGIEAFGADLVTTSYNNIWGGGNIGFTPGTGDISYDPRFEDPATHDYHLQIGSASVDTGDPGDDYTYEPTPNGGRINQGVYGNTADATVNYPPALYPIEPKVYEVGSDIIPFKIAAADSYGSILSYSAQVLPGLISISDDNSTATLSGIAQQEGIHQVEVTVSDGNLTDSEIFTVEIRTNSTPELEPISNITTTANHSILLDVNATDADGDSLSYSTTGPGTIDVITGQYYWRPVCTAIGTNYITIEVTDGIEGSTDAAVFQVTVTDVPEGTYEICNNTLDDDCDGERDEPSCRTESGISPSCLKKIDGRLVNLCDVNTDLPLHY
ncbi:right-handed parallel beta-helix repeat-containing protein [Patescibacteria group bacterium]